MSSKLIVAPNCFAKINSSAGVSLEENMISLPSNPQRSDIISSVKDEQSVPHPSSFKIFKIVGFGVAFTAKYSLNPLFHENAFFKRSAFARIPFSSYRWYGVGYFFTISSNCSFVTNGTFAMVFGSFLLYFCIFISFLIVVFHWPVHL